MPKYRKVTWDGVVYPTLKAAAEALDIDCAALYWRLKAGYTSDKEMRGRGDRVVIWNGIKYDSIKQAAKACGVNYKTMWERIERGHTDDSDLKPAPRRPAPRATCLICKVPLEKSKQRYCSDTCKRKAANQRYYQRNRKQIIKRVLARKNQDSRK